MTKRFMITAAVLGLLAVVFGAFGAHALKDRLTASEFETWRTAVSYQFYHALAILFIANAATANRSFLKLSYSFFLTGVILFSGSLYLLATHSITGIYAPHLLGPITPAGGLFLILGWLFLLLAALKNK